jgi:uncharacterized damage-inducible protein DinB
MPSSWSPSSAPPYSPAARKKTAPTLRSILLEQFRTTWNQQDWFVPVSKSLNGLNAKQAMWRPSDSSHSIGQSWYSVIAHISAHNAYHTGQILYIRKLAGNWDPEKGVK